MKMENIDSVYNNNETATLILNDKYESFLSDDYIIFKNMLDDVKSLNISHIIIKGMNYSCYEKFREFLEENNPDIKIVWRTQMKELKEIKGNAHMYSKKDQILCNLDFRLDSKEVIYSILNKMKEIFKISVIYKVGKDNFVDALNVIAEISQHIDTSIVVSPNMEADSSNKLNWPQLDQLYGELIEFNIKRKNPKATLMDLGILPSRLLNEHPCNGYVCYKDTCHSKKNDLPRRIVVKRNGCLLPENERVNSKLIMGNIGREPLSVVLSKYQISYEHKLFKDVCKSLYIKWIPTNPYCVVPWGELLVEESYGIE